MYPTSYSYHPPPYNTFPPPYNAYHHSPYNTNCSSQPYHAPSNFFSQRNYRVPGIQPTLPVPPSIQMLPPASHTQSSDYDDDSSQGNPVFTLQKLSGKIRKCYGCTCNIRDDTSTIPNPPYDLVVRYKEWRYYRDTSTQTLKLTKNEENTYYHLMQRCIQMKHPSFNASMLYIPAEIMDNLLPHTYLITLAFISRTISLICTLELFH